MKLDRCEDEQDIWMLLNQAEAGDHGASGRLLEHYRARLRTIAASRLDRRMAARVDPSDVAQESLVEAARRLDPYLRDRPLPFYPWLCQIVREKLIDARRRHLHAASRSIGREEMTHRISGIEAISPDTSPSGRAVRDEGHARVHSALSRLSERDRQVLMMRHFEGLSASQAAEALDLSEEAAKSRHRRALERLRDQLGTNQEEDSR
jgi:RNA polymerase sigma-70 factor (ECF subfamily)